MRISKQPSGGNSATGGRGEFELAEDVPGGPRVTDLFGCDLVLKFGSHVIPSGIFLKHQGGKRRLRLRNQRTTVHAGLQAAAILMMPGPIRDEARLEGGLPVLRSGGYLLHHIELEDVHLVQPAVFLDGKTAAAELEPGLFTATAKEVIYGNQSFQAETLQVSDRMIDLESIWQGAGELPIELASLIATHRQAVTAGTPVPNTLGKTVQAIQESFESCADDFGVIYSKLEDPVPAILSAIGKAPAKEVDLIPLEQIPRDQVDIRKRTIDRWRLVRSRGPSAIKFRKTVREVYDWTCVVCGVQFPPTDFNRNPGVDSAHILPWATHNVDHVTNGVCLCKTHHWAFDEGLIRITFRDEQYFVELGPEVKVSINDVRFSLDDLEKVVGAIPSYRLPNLYSERPSPAYLEELYSQLD